MICFFVNELLNIYNSERLAKNHLIIFRLLLARAERNMCVLTAIGSSNLAKYTKNLKNIGPDAIRTHDLWFRKPLLYPAELRGHIGF